MSLDLDFRIRPDFTVGELCCQCGCGYGREIIDYNPEALDLLQGIRYEVARPVIVNSGLRCENHNNAEGGIEQSAHTRAAAWDLKATGSRERRELVDAAVRRGARGIGVAGTFIHTDMDRSGLLPRPGIWPY